MGLIEVCLFGIVLYCLWDHFLRGFTSWQVPRAAWIVICCDLLCLLGRRGGAAGLVDVESILITF